MTGISHFALWSTFIHVIARVGASFLFIIEEYCIWSFEFFSSHTLFIQDGGPFHGIKTLSIWLFSLSLLSIYLTTVSHTLLLTVAYGQCLCLRSLWYPPPSTLSTSPFPCLPSPLPAPSNYKYLVLIRLLCCHFRSIFLWHFVQMNGFAWTNLVNHRLYRRNAKSLHFWPLFSLPSFPGNQTFFLAHFFITLASCCWQ